MPTGRPSPTRAKPTISTEEKLPTRATGLGVEIRLDERRGPRERRDECPEGLLLIVLGALALPIVRRRADASAGASSPRGESSVRADIGARHAGCGGYDRMTRSAGDGGAYGNEGYRCESSHETERRHCTWNAASGTRIVSSGRTVSI